MRCTVDVHDRSYNSEDVELTPAPTATAPTVSITPIIRV